MRWLSWTLAYLFDCIHPHTIWPRRHQTGFNYVACLDCGRELPYSLDRMSTVTRAELLADRIDLSIHNLLQDSKAQNPQAAESTPALRVREVWHAPCLYPYVTERIHAEDINH
jgi:hypothetical protein